MLWHVSGGRNQGAWQCRECKWGCGIASGESVKREWHIRLLMLWREGQGGVALGIWPISGKAIGSLCTVIFPVHAVVTAISAINGAVVGCDPVVTMATLNAPAAAIRSITDECAAAYNEKLAAARQDKLDSGE